MERLELPTSLLERYDLKESLESKDLNGYKIYHKLMRKQMFVYAVESSSLDQFTYRLQENGSTILDKYIEGNYTFIVVDNKLKEATGDLSTAQNKKRIKIVESSGYEKIIHKRSLRNFLISLSCILVLSGVMYIIYVNDVFGYRISEDDEVDLGLSVIWSSKNLGASTVEQDGDFFAWGEIEPKDEYTEFSYLYSNNNNYSFIGDDISGTQYDAASVKLKNGWRMPTKYELDELFSKCKWEEVYYNDKTGFIVTGPNKKSIFIPCSGHIDGTFHNGNTYYWSSTFHEEPERGRKCNAWNLAVDIFMDGYHDYTGTNHIFQRRYIGRAIRPVKNK